MADIAQIGFAADTSALKTAKSDLQAIVPAAGAAENAAGRLSGEMSRLQAAATGAATAASKVAVAATGQAASVTQAAVAQQTFTTATKAAVAPVQSMQFNTSNLAAQFQDIGVTAAAGMNPLMIALQQGTQISAVLAQTGGTAASAMTQLGGALKSVFSPLALMTIGVVAAVAALIQLVPWTKIAQYSLRSMATGIQNVKDGLKLIAPYVVAFGALLLLWNIPLILSGLATMTMAIYGMARALVVLTFSNPFTAMAFAIGVVIAGIIAYRREISQLLGADIIAEIKKPFNLLIGLGVAVVNTLLLTFQRFPIAMQVLWAQAVSGFKVFANQIIEGADTVMKLLPSFLGGQAAGIEFRFDPSWTVEMDKSAAGLADKYRAVVKSAFDADYIGGAASAVGKGADIASAKLRKWADALGDASKAYKKLINSATSHLAVAKLEQDSIGMSAERASVLKEQLTLLDKAREDGIKLTKAQTRELMSFGEIIGRTKADTEKLKAAFDFSKDAVRGFVTDLRDGLKEGANLLKVFADAATNLLTKVSDKLIDLAINMLFESQKGGATGGLFGSLVKFFGPLFGTPGTGTDPMASPSVNGATKLAKGGAFTNGVYHSPTMFKFASGGQFGMMGEAGPEAVMPLKRGPDGSLGVQVNGGGSGGNGGGPSVVVIVENNADNTAVRQETSSGPDGREMRRIIIDTVRHATASGDLDASMRARYGSNPTKITRG